MTETPSSVEADADRALKASHRAMWASSDYPAMASAFSHGLGRTLIEATGVTQGDVVLDVAAGTGAAAIPAALTGARVTASDLTPELFDAGRARAAAHSVDITWEEGDAEALPYDDNTFDTVLSCVGVMFAPHHQTAVDELVRVCRPGGTIGLLSWVPEGFADQVAKVMQPHVPAPPPGAQQPTLWGSEEYLQGLFGDRLTDVSARNERLRVEQFADGAKVIDFFMNHGFVAYRKIINDHDLYGDMVDVAQGFFVGPGVMEWEYLLYTARVAYPSAVETH